MGAVTVTICVGSVFFIFVFLANTHVNYSPVLSCTLAMGISQRLIFWPLIDAISTSAILRRCQSSPALGMDVSEVAGEVKRKESVSEKVVEEGAWKNGFEQEDFHQDAEVILRVSMNDIAKFAAQKRHRRGKDIGGQRMLEAKADAGAPARNLKNNNINQYCTLAKKEEDGGAIPMMAAKSAKSDADAPARNSKKKNMSHQHCKGAKEDEDNGAIPMMAAKSDAGAPARNLNKTNMKHQHCKGAQEEGDDGLIPVAAADAVAPVKNLEKKSMKHKHCQGAKEDEDDGSTPMMAAQSDADAPAKNLEKKSMTHKHCKGAMEDPMMAAKSDADAPAKLGEKEHEAQALQRRHGRSNDGSEV